MSDVQTLNEIMAKLEDLKYLKLSSFKHQWLNLTYAKEKETAEELIKKFGEKM